jgi:cobalt/nickel transport system ATP-binding protein
VLEMLQLANLRDRSPHRLCGGEKKKVAIASVLVLNTEVLNTGTNQPADWTQKQKSAGGAAAETEPQGRTIIVSTHNLELAHVLTTRSLCAGRVT